MSTDLTGAVAVVTGASSGIGQATSEALAAEGAAVVLAARSEETIADYAREIREEYETEALAVATDVSEPAAVEALVETTVEELGSLDILVNNAGTAGDGTVAEMPLEVYETVTGVNVNGVFYATKFAIPHLLKTDGSVIYIGSFAGNYPRPQFPVYAATKWWVKGFALSVAGRFGKEGLGVTLVNPSAVRTNFETEDSTFREEYSHEEAIEPEEVADLVVTAAKQRSPISLNSVDIYNRDRMSNF
ncbi:SDR family oxidoreductase [Haloferax sp. AB510]|uniref:SDR family oxidoreductase n=1 Tax=Haloferax sp. AB510 TaxID=2934172 RepID=UPI00209C0B67|nr:SDR family oxidoreductase [Haloferax sp. AB510]MCO8267153.1 SDR family oxidoreductase [Haloferax sp. AB510]